MQYFETIPQSSCKPAWEQSEIALKGKQISDTTRVDLL